ncbi:MAG: hypothetical protein NVS9B10_28900 [Nevskia sp.]
MERARDQLLAGAGFAGDQHRDLRLRQPADRAEHVLHRRRLADDRGARLGRLRLRHGHALLRGTAHERGDAVDVERLRQVFEGAAAERGDGGIEIGMRGDDDDRQLRPQRAHALHQRQAIEAGHADVRDQDVGTLGILVQRVQQLGRAGKAPDRHAFAAQGFFENPADRLVVVDDPDPDRTLNQLQCIHRASCLAMRGSFLRGRRGGA